MANATQSELEKYIKASPAKKKDENASFEYKDMDDVLYLSVTPPRGAGRHIKAENIIQGLKRKGFDATAKFETLKQIIKLTETRNVKVFNYPLEVEKLDMAEKAIEKEEISAHISEDEMSAYLDINIDHAKKIMPEEFIKILRDTSITYGVKIETLEKLSKYLEEKPYKKKLVIAQGRKEKKGRDAAFKLKPGFKKIDQTMEFRSEILEKNTLVAMKTPAEQSLPQKLVTGREINIDKEKYKDFIIETGFGIREVIKEDGSVNYITQQRGVTVFDKKKQNIYLIPVVDAEFTLNFNSDKTALIFDAVVGKNKMADLKLDQIIEFIKRMQIKKDFLDLKLLKQEIEKLNAGEVSAVQGLVIAEGKKPVHGENGKLKYVSDFGNYRKVHYREDGSVDHRLSTSLYSVKPDEVIANISPPDKNKKDGVDVCGEVIEAKSGKWPNVKAGDGVKISEDGLQIIATRNGQIRQEGPIIKVEPVLLIPGDLDYSTGSVNFKGSVTINGNVLDGFNIFCTGDLIIKGNVGAAKIVCEGTATIEGGIAGRNKAAIFVVGNLYVSYIEQARVETRGDIHIRKNTTLSRIYSAKRIVYAQKNPNAAVIGCRLMAKEIVDVSKIGSERGGAESAIILGFDYDLIRTNKRIQKHLMNVQNEIMRINKAREALESKPESSQEEMGRLNENLNINLDKFDMILAIQNDILKIMETKQENFMIVRKNIYPDATIIMDNYKKQIKEQQKACVFHVDYENKKIDIEKFDPGKEYYTLDGDEE